MTDQAGPRGGRAQRANRGHGARPDARPEQVEEAPAAAIGLASIEVIARAPAGPSAWIRRPGWRMVGVSVVIALIAAAAGILWRDDGPGTRRAVFEAALADLAAAPALRYTTSGFGGEVVVPYEVTATGEARAHIDDLASLPGDISSDLLFVDDKLFVRTTGSIDLEDLGLDTSDPVVAEALEDAQNQEGMLGSGDWITSVSEYDGPIVRDSMSPVGLAIKLTDLLVQTPDDQLRDEGDEVDGTPALVAETGGGEIYVSAASPHRVLRFVPARPPGAEDSPPPTVPSLPSIPDLSGAPGAPEVPGLPPGAVTPPQAGPGSGEPPPLPPLPSIPDLSGAPGAPEVPGLPPGAVTPPQAAPDPAPGPAPGGEPSTPAEAVDAAVPLLEQAVDHIDLEVLDGDEVQQVYDEIADATAELDGAVDGVLQFAEGEMAESLAEATRSGDALGDCGAESCEVEADATLVHGRGNEVPTRLTFAMTVDGRPAGRCTARGVIPVSGTGPLGCTNDSEEWTAAYRPGADVAVEVADIEAMAFTPEDVETVTAAIDAHAEAVAATDGDSGGGLLGVQSAGVGGPGVEAFAGGGARVADTGVDPLEPLFRSLDIEPSRWGDLVDRVGNAATQRLPVAERITAADVEVLRRVLLEGVQYRPQGDLIDRIDRDSARRVILRALGAQTRSELLHAVDTFRVAYRIIRTSELAPGRQDSLAPGARILLDVGEPTATSGSHVVDLSELALHGVRPPPIRTFPDGDASTVPRDQWGNPVYPGQSWGRAVWADAHREIMEGAPEEREALLDWLQSSYDDVRRYLLGEQLPNPQRRAEVAAMVRHLDNALNRKPVPERLIAVRATNPDELGVENLEDVLDLRPGEIISQPHYIATALRGRPHHPGRVHLYLEVPEGTPGFFMEGDATVDANGQRWLAAELLLGRGLTWEITKRPTAGTGIVEVHGRILPPAGATERGGTGPDQSSPDDSAARSTTRTIDVLYPSGDGTWNARAVMHDASRAPTAQGAEQLQVLRGVNQLGGEGGVDIVQDGNVDELFTPTGTQPSAAPDADRAPVGEVTAPAGASQAERQAAERHRESARALSAAGYAAEPGGDTGVAVADSTAVTQAPGETGLDVEGTRFGAKAPAASTSMRDFVRDQLTDGQANYVVNLNDQANPEEAHQELMNELSEGPAPGLSEALVVKGDQVSSIVPYEGTPIEQIAGQPPSTTGSPGAGGSGGTGTGADASTRARQRVRVHVPIPPVPPPAPAPTSPAAPAPTTPTPGPTSPPAPAPTTPTPGPTSPPAPAPTTPAPAPTSPPATTPTRTPTPGPTSPPATTPTRTPTPSGPPPSAPAGTPPASPSPPRPTPPLSASIAGGRVELTPPQAADVAAQGRQMIDPRTGNVASGAASSISSAMGMRQVMTSRGVEMHKLTCTCPPCQPTSAT